MFPLFTILICLIFAYLFSEILRWFGMPRVVGQICAGFFLGAGAIKGALFSPENLHVLNFLATLGIVLLFYYIGLEMSFKSLAKKMKKAVIVSLFKAVIPLVIGFLVSKYLLGYDNLASVLVGIIISAGAQSVSVDLLEEMKMLKSKIGAVLVSVGVITDLIELLIAGTVLALFEVSTQYTALPHFLFYMALFLLFIVFARAWFVPFTLKIFDREKSSTSRFMGAMIIVLLVVSLSEFLGLGAMIGAVAAGLIIRQTIFRDITIPNWEEHDIARSIHIVAFGFLIPLFFVWVGVNTDLSMLIENYTLVLIFFAIAVAGVIGGTILAVKLAKGSYAEGFTLGWGLSPKGDIGFVLGALALESAIITDQIFSALVIMSLIITIISPIIFKRLVLKYDHKL